MFLLSTDIDGTVYEPRDNGQLFGDYWAKLQGRLTPAPRLVYNTGRSLADTRRLIEHSHLPDPEWIISGVGSTIAQRGASGPFAPWSEHLSPGWEQAAIHDYIGQQDLAQAQPAECQSSFKSSWFWENASPEALAQLEQGLRAQGWEAQLVYSSQRDLDILPKRANKGNALRFLAQELVVSLREVIVAGDSGNDLSMIEIPEVFGIIVNNAESSLREASFASPRYLASEESALGVQEGLESFLEKPPLPRPAAADPC
ncbi:MAG: HAD-IIB family hydrolase [Verrucomicrobiota bacterium]